MEGNLDRKTILNKRKEIFFRDHDRYSNKLMKDLIDFRVDLNPDSKKDIQRFFNNIKVKASMLGYDDLSKIAGYYDHYIENKDIIDDDPHEIFSDILKGVGVIKRYVRKLEEGVYKKNNKKESSEEDPVQLNVSKNKGNILLLDDDKLISAILKDEFEKQGYSMMTTTDHEEAIEYILYKDINIALIDIVMPKMNGFDVFDILKKNGVDIPIIFLSGKSFTHYKVDALSRGVDDYITKPFEIKEVVARVERSLGRAKQYKNKLNRDKLTGLFNKEYFNKYVTELIKRGRHLEQNYSVAFMDLDDFKYINDNYGHVTGDYVLKDFAFFLQNTLDSEDIVFRFGGDEFIVLFVDKNLDTAYKSMEDARKKLNETIFRYKDVEENIKVHVSTGITGIEKNDSAEDILKRADKCLYVSKELNKNTTVCSNTLLD